MSSTCVNAVLHRVAHLCQCADARRDASFVLMAVGHVSPDRAICRLRAICGTILLWRTWARPRKRSHGPGAAGVFEACWRAHGLSRLQVGAPLAHQLV